MDKRAHVLITGIVHGVFFRTSIRAKAHHYKLTGWVRNTSKGQVEALFEGERDDIEKVLEFCSAGPPGSVIENIKIEWSDPNKNFTDFEIRE